MDGERWFDASWKGIPRSINWSFDVVHKGLGLKYWCWNNSLWRTPWCWNDTPRRRLETVVSWEEAWEWNDRPRGRLETVVSWEEALEWNDRVGIKKPWYGRASKTFADRRRIGKCASHFDTRTRSGAVPILSGRTLPPRLEQSWPVADLLAGSEDW